MFKQLVPPLNMGMLLLALFPILKYYATPLSISWGELLLLLFVAYEIGIKKGNALEYPKHFILYWGYCAVTTLVLSNTFKITYLIPGGISTFIWCLMLGVLLHKRDIDALLCYFRLIFIPIAVLFVVQELSYTFLGSRFVFQLPISSETAYYGGLTFEQLKLVQTFGERSTSLFLEPAYFAEYLLIHLCLELFSGEGVNKLYTPWALYIGLILLLLRSGTGLIGLVLLATIKLISYYKRARSRKVIALMMVLIPLLFVGATYYISTEIGESMLQRQSELTNQSGSAYHRIFRGLELYNAMPIFHKIVGMDSAIFRENNFYNGIETLKEGMLFNGFQTVLITKGLLGMIFLLMIYISIYRNSNILTKASLLLFLFMSWVESIYMMPAMLILTVIAYADKMKKQNRKTIQLNK